LRAIPPRRRFPFPSWILATVLLLATACGGDPAGPQPRDPAPESLPPDPGGILLPGEGPALDAVRTMLQSPAPPAEVDDGLLLTRIEAWLDPAVTVVELNTILRDQDARILGMTHGVPLLSLVVEAVADEDGALQRAADLMSSGAFLYAFPARVPVTGPVEPAGKRASGKRIEPDAGALPLHLQPSRTAAAWNVRGRAVAVNAPVPVLVADLFSELTPHPEIPAMRFPAGIMGGAQPGENHGWHVTGTIAADFGGGTPVGVHPDADVLLDVQCLPDGGLSWSGTCSQLLSLLPTSGHFVISTSLGWSVDEALAAANGGNWSTQQLMEGATLALAWRIGTVGSWDRFLHSTAAGNEGEYAGNMDDARLASPWTIAHSYEDPRTLFAPGALSPVQQAALDAMWTMVQDHYPAAAQAQPNVLVVGSSDAGGAESDFSNAGSDLRAVGEDVPNTCRAADDDCDGQIEVMSGTSMATPQVAAVASWLWNLRPDLDAAGLRERLVRGSTAAETAGVLDHYLVTQAADASLASAPVRRHLLDVAGGSTTPGTNGLFDEHDLELFLEFFESYELLRDGNNFRDDSRYDLNGDGLTGGDTRAGFDLDVDALPALETVEFDADGNTLSLEESHVRDLDILCYYAFTDLYGGDTDRRSELLAGCIGDAAGLEVSVQSWDEEMLPDGDNELVVVVRRDSQPVVNALVSLTVQGGTATSTSGSTDAQGAFRSTVRFSPDSDLIEVELTATESGDSRTIDLECSAIEETSGRVVVQGNWTYARAQANICCFDPGPDSSETTTDSDTDAPLENETKHVTADATATSDSPDLQVSGDASAVTTAHFEYELDATDGSLRELRTHGSSTLAASISDPEEIFSQSLAKTSIYHELTLDIVGGDVPFTVTGTATHDYKLKILLLDIGTNELLVEYDISRSETISAPHQPLTTPIADEGTMLVDRSYRVIVNVAGFKEINMGGESSLTDMNSLDVTFRFGGE